MSEQETAPVAETKGSEVASEKVFPESQVQKMIQDRVSKAHKEVESYKSEIETLKSQLAEKPKKNSNADEDFKNQLTAKDTELKTFSDKYNKLRSDYLNSVVEQKLTSLNCSKPNLALKVLLADNVITYDEDGNIVATNSVDGNVDGALKKFLAENPELVKPTAQNPVGARASKPNVNTATSDREDMKSTLYRTLQGG